ncbi:MAG: NfeD family protein [Cyclobacteriaceae bacterium]
MEWIIVGSLITLGLILIIIEVLFVPGTTIVGILGFIFEIGGVYLAYDYFGETTGTIVLIAAFVISTTCIILSFKSDLWKKLSLKEEHTTTVNEGKTSGLSVGLTGITLSSLKPIGKALFNDREYEVRTFGKFLYNDEKVAIVKLENNTIIVEHID